MTFSLRHFTGAVLGALCALATSATALPGGRTSEVMARQVAEQLQAALKQPVVIDNFQLSKAQGDVNLQLTAIRSNWGDSG